MPSCDASVDTKEPEIVICNVMDTVMWWNCTQVRPVVFDEFDPALALFPELDVPVNGGGNEEKGLFGAVDEGDAVSMHVTFPRVRNCNGRI